MASGRFTFSLGPSSPLCAMLACKGHITLLLLRAAFLRIFGSSAEFLLGVAILSFLSILILLCPRCGLAQSLLLRAAALCAIGPSWDVLAVLAGRAPLLLCPRRGPWPYHSSPSGGRAVMCYWPVLLPSCFVFGVAYSIFLHLRATPCRAFGKSCCVPPLSSAHFAVSLALYTRAAPLHASLSVLSSA